ncbi:MAG TPA: type II toxin-antitoxin system RelE/ParE family toxin [Xanthobacteraceae bacterium]
MVFIETPIFTRQVVEALTDEQYGLLQASLGRPDAGDLIKGSGGIRKLRWALPGRGKRGGIRVVYFWRVTESQIMMLTMYAKNEQANLTAAQVKQLAKLVEALK